MAELKNPWWERIEANPAYNRIDDKCEEMLAASTPDPEEQIVSSLHLNHGTGKMGYLVLTTHWIRWFDTFKLFKKSAKWPLTSSMSDASTGPMGVIRLDTGDQFQSRGLSSRKLSEFVHLYHALQQAAQWDDEHAPAAPTAIVAAASEADELEKFAALRDRGIITEEQFQAKKRKILGF